MNDFLLAVSVFFVPRSSGVYMIDLLCSNDVTFLFRLSLLRPKNKLFVFAINDWFAGDFDELGIYIEWKHICSKK